MNITCNCYEAIALSWDTKAKRETLPKKKKNETRNTTTQSQIEFHKQRLSVSRVESEKEEKVLKNIMPNYRFLLKVPM